MTEHDHTITLTNVRISGIRHWFPNTTDTIGSFLPQMVEVNFTDQNITIKHELSGTETSMGVKP